MLYFTCKKKKSVVFTANQAVIMEYGEYGMMVSSRTFKINFSSLTLICT